MHRCYRRGGDPEYRALARAILFAGIKHIGAFRASSLTAANVFLTMCLGMVQATNVDFPGNMLLT